MRRLAVLAAMAGALLVPSLALASGPPLARYTTKVTTPSTLKGTWTFTFAKGGTYTIAQGGAVVVHGHYAALGSEITLSRETGPEGLPAVRRLPLEANGEDAEVHAGERPVRRPRAGAGAHLHGGRLNETGA